MRSSAPVKFTRQEWEILIILAAMQFFNILDFMLLIPLADVVKRKFDIASPEFGHLVAAYGVAAAVAALIASLFIDRFDRKHALLGLLGGFAVSTGACALSFNYQTMLASRIAAGMFGGVMGSVVMATIGDLFADSRRGTATGVVMSAFALATVMGVPLALTIAEYSGLGAPFGVLAVLGALLAIPIFLVLPSLTRHRLAHRPPGFRQFGDVLGNREHLKAYLFSASVASGGFLVIPYLSDYIVNNIGRPQSDVKYVYLVSGLCTLVSLNVIGRLSDRFGKKTVFRIVAVVAMLMTLILTNLPALALPTTMLATAFYMVFTSGRMVPAQALITNVPVPEERGGFLSLNTAVMHFTMGIAAAVSGAMIAEGPNREIVGFARVGLLSAVMAVASLVLVGFLRGARTAQPVQQIAEPDGAEAIAEAAA